MTVKWMWIFVFMVFILNHAHGQVVVRDSVEVMPDPTTIRANSVQGLGKYECDFSFGFSLNRDADNRYVLYNNENELVSTCTFDAGRTQVNLSGYPIPWNLSFTAGLIEISHPNRSIRIWANEDVSTEGYMLVFFRMWADQLEVRLGFFNSLGYGSFPDTHPGDNVYIAMVRYYWMDQGYTPQEVKVICDYEYEVTFNDVPITFHIDNARTGLYALNTTENPPALRHNGISTISIIAEKQFPEDPEPSITEDSLLDFKMDDGCEQYGSLIGSDGQKVKTLTGITYGSARQGGVKFIADGIQPEQEETAFILFTERVRPDCPHYSFVTLLPSDSLSFNVTFSKDTLRHSESSSVFVQAMKNGEPIEPLEGTRLFFSMDSNGQKYGSLRLPDSTIVHPDMSIPYADAISGKIKFFTDGKEPDSTANVMINVINTEEPAWSGSGHVSIGADSI
jgi:hypothetical protein